MAFPRLNNISFWRALLWILIANIFKILQKFYLQKINFYIIINNIILFIIVPLAIPHSLSQVVNRTAGSQHGSASEALWTFNFFFKKSLTCFFCIGFFGFPALLNLYYRFPLELITSLINKWLIILNHYMNFLYKSNLTIEMFFILLYLLLS